MKKFTTKIKALWKTAVTLFAKKDSFFMFTVANGQEIDLMHYRTELAEESSVQALLIIAATASKSLYEDHYIPDPRLKRLFGEKVISTERTSDQKKMMQLIIKSVQLMTPFICIQIKNNREGMQDLAGAFMDFTSQAIAYIKSIDNDIDIDEEKIQSLEKSAIHNHKYILSLLEKEGQSDTE